MSYSAKEKLRVIERELDYRRRLYPRLIANNAMSQKTADLQIAILEEIAEDYAKQHAKEILL